MMILLKLLNTVYNKTDEELPYEIEELRRRILIFSSYKRIKHSLGYYLLPVSSVSYALIFFTSLFILFLMFLADNKEIINTDYIVQLITNLFN